MDLPLRITTGEKYDPAMKVTDQAEADEMFERLVRHSLATGASSRQEAERIERSNLGYYAGYYDQETRLRVEKLYRCTHPVLGPATIQHTPEEILKMGMEVGKAGKIQEFGQSKPISRWDNE